MSDTPRQESIKAGSSDISEEPVSLEKTEEALQRVDIHSVALTGLFLIALLYTFHFARLFLMPVAFALLLNFMLRPILLLMKKVRIPTPLAAAIIVLGMMAAIGIGMVQMGKPAAEWASKAPAAVREVKGKLSDLGARVQRISQMAREVENITTPSNEKPAQEVQLREPNPAYALITNTRDFFTSTIIVVVLLFFLLAYEDLFLLKMVKVLPKFSSKKRARIITRDMERQVSKYLLTVSLINAGLGFFVGLAFFFIGLPNPILWGIMVAILNFVPYLGAIAGTIIIIFVSFITFDSWLQILLAPTVYYVINTLEGNIVTPAILGKQFTLNPAAIFIWLVFWSWIWGIPGAFLAAPMLTCFKILCDNFEPMRPLGEFLGS